MSDQSTETSTAADLAEISEQQQVRRDKRARMIGTGREPYPVDMHRTHTLSEVRAGWPDLDKGEETQDVVEIGGRVVFLRNTGKLCFATLQDGFSQDSSGERLQVMISLAEVGEQALADWKADVDLGDFVWVRGRVILAAPRRTVGDGLRVEDRQQGASSAARSSQGAFRRIAGAAALRRPDRAPRGARHVVRLRAAITRSLRETLDSEGSS